MLPLKTMCLSYIMYKDIEVNEGDVPSDILKDLNNMKKVKGVVAIKGIVQRNLRRHHSEWQETKESFWRTVNRDDISVIEIDEHLRDFMQGWEEYSNRRIYLLKKLRKAKRLIRSGIQLIPYEIDYHK